MGKVFSSVYSNCSILWHAASPTFLYDIMGNPVDIKNSIKDDESEYSIINSSFLTKCQYVLQLTVPTLPLPRPHRLPSSITNVIFGHPPELIKSNMNIKSHQMGEKWFYINGIGTCKEICVKTQKKLERIFNVPVDAIYDPCNSILVDLFQCWTEKQWNDQYPITFLTYQILVNSLTDETITKVIFICHSRGTIITANVLQMLQCLRPQYLKKLEIYAFANCSTKMTHIGFDENTQQPYPYIENIGNINDTVAKLGMFSPHGSIVIDGPEFVNYEKQGHLMNMSYLDHFDSKIDYVDKNGTASKLYTYLNKNSSVDDRSITNNKI